MADGIQELLNSMRDMRTAWNDLVNAVNRVNVIMHRVLGGADEGGEPAPGQVALPVFPAATGKWERTTSGSIFGRILGYLDAEDGDRQAVEIARAINFDLKRGHRSFYSALSKLAKDGRIIRTGHGRYRSSKAGTAAGGGRAARRESESEVQPKGKLGGRR